MKKRGFVNITASNDAKSRKFKNQSCITQNVSVTHRVHNALKTHVH